MFLRDLDRFCGTIGKFKQLDRGSTVSGIMSSAARVGRLWHDSSNGSYIQNTSFWCAPEVQTSALSPRS